MRSFRRFAHLLLVLPLILGPGMLAAAHPLGPLAGPTCSPLASPGDVVINEVAWMGTGSTAAQTNDEWIELYNNTAAAISLVGWRLVDDDTMNIALTGSIPPQGYYLIERTDDTAVSDVAADWYGSFGTGGLSNSGEVLTLTDSLGNVIDTANGENGGKWPAGTAVPDYRSMERIDPAAPDTDTNWGSNTTWIRNGHNVSGNPINGTPKARNSRSWPDLSTAKSAPATVQAGNPITYTLTISNAGPFAAPGVRVTDTLPAGVAFVTQTSSLALPFTQVDTHTLLWQAASLPADTVAHITLTGSVAVTASGTLVNQVRAATSSTEVTSTNDLAQASSTVQPTYPDLVAAKGGPAHTHAGDPITYTLTVSNAGLLPAPNLRITDTLPAGVALVTQTNSFTLTFSQASSRTLLWQASSLPAGTVAHVTLTGQVAVSANGDLVNHLSTSTTAGEATLANNTAACTTTAEITGAAHLLIESVLFNGYQLSDHDEAVRLVNSGDGPADLAGWKICDAATGGSCAALPPTTLEPGHSLWLAWYGTAFFTSSGFLPNFEKADTSPAVPNLSGTWPGYSNSGDEVVLRDPANSVVDTLVYGAGITGTTGWSGAALFPYQGSGFGAEGQILQRILDETTGLPIADTDTAADWLQYPADAAYGRRVLYPGWDLDPFFWPLSVTEQASLTVAIAPDHAAEVFLAAIERAQSRIEAEFYELGNYDIVQALVLKAQAGVSVTVLLEGEVAGAPGGISNQERWACQQLEQQTSGHGQCWFMFNQAGSRIYDRYTAVHSKMVLIDRQWVVISSQNPTAGGLPSDDKSDGTWGSRGVLLITDAPSVLARAAAIFAADLDPAHHNDLARWSPLSPYGYGLPPDGFLPITSSGGITSTVLFPEPLVTSGTVGLELFSAPEAALRHSDALLGLLPQAGLGDSVDVQQMYEYRSWRTMPNGDPAPNLRLEAYIQAARQGARVRILLNSGSFGQWSTNITATMETVAYVNQIARNEGLDLEARPSDPTRYGIHNKMVLLYLHGHGYAHIGSINGSESSSKINREVAIQVRSDTVYDYLEKMFESDWRRSKGIYLPLLVRRHVGPANHLVISEVLFNPVGAEPGGEWVELYNPTFVGVDLSGWVLGDAARLREYGSGRYAFPAGTTIPPQGLLVIAAQAKDVSGFVPNLEFLIDRSRDDPNVPNMVPIGSWPGFGFALGNSGDEVILGDAARKTVDVLVYGTGSYPGVIPHPAGIGAGHSLARRPPDRDSDDCSGDFFDQYPPTPGQLPLE